MQYLTWNIAKNSHIEDPKLRELMRGVLIRSFAHNQLTLDYVQSDLPIKVYPIEQELDLSTTNCVRCKVGHLSVQLTSQRSSLKYSTSYLLTWHKVLPKTICYHTTLIAFSVHTKLDSKTWKCGKSTPWTILLTFWINSN